MPNLIIGSRGSKLALWQSNWVKERLEEVYEGLVVNIEVVKTTGDKLTEASLAQIGGKGVFTKEIEEALLDHRVDLAVHSLKDLPTILPDGLRIAAITEREDVRDALIVSEDLRKYIINSIEDLPRNARVGTSSLRRASQLRHSRPDLEIIELRGNVETRLRKLYEGDYDAIVLASAGLRRLGFDHSIAAYLSTMEMLPAVGQGALAIETRNDDQRVNILLEVLNHQQTRYATEAERAVLRSLGGGCAVPIAAHAQFKKNRISHKLVVEALVADVEGRNLIRRQIAGQAQDAERLGVKLAEMLIEAGARDLLPRIGGVQTSDPAQMGDGPNDDKNGAAEGVESPPPLIVAQSEESPATKTENGAAPATAPASALPAPVEGEPAIRTEYGIAHTSSVTPPTKTENGAAPPTPPTKTENGAAPPLAIMAPSEVVELAIKSENGAAHSSAPPAPAVAVQRDGLHATIAENGVAPPQPMIMRLSEEDHAIGGENGEKLRPLHGRRVIVTRAVKQSGEMMRSLTTLGADVISCPTIEIKAPSSWEQLDRALIHLSWYDWLVFTSVNGVEYFLWRMDALGHGRGELEYHRICAVGRKTAEKLESENIMVDLTPERFTAEALVEAFGANFSYQRLYGSRMLLPASRATRDVIRPAMEKIGVYVEVVEAYQTVAPAAKGENMVRLFRDAGADYIVFTSPSTVENLAAILETDHLAPHLANTRVACIGPVTAEAARSHGLTVHIQPDEHTGQAIVTAIVADSYEKRYASFL
ncbi:MAG: hydroxymethylbilane synthase [Chloracidobacterium sp.]|nr:hydroxymethylbilane synthase [Chloracidobacterium sp.]